LKGIGKQYRGHIITDLWNGFEIDSFFIRNIFAFISINTFLLVTLSIILPKLFIIWLFIFLIINLTIYINTNTIISQFSGSINYILHGVTFLKNIKKDKLDIMSLKIPDYEKFKHLRWCTFLFHDGLTSASSESPISMLLDYIRIFLSFEALSFKITYNIILENIEVVRNLIYFIGYYDCILNIAEILEKYETSFTDYKDCTEIDFQEMYHPLIKNPVKQSAKINSGLIITGLNMAGKSTFMKTIALNQLFSTSLGFSFSKKMSTDIFRIITSFRINDSLLQNKSRYFAEAERIASIIKNIEKDKCLCFIDEILSGTNSKDRIHGSVEILKQLSRTNTSIVISATHDIEIAKNLEGLYDLGYFDGNISGKNIVFDFILKPGIVSERNGLLILELLGIDV
jgi:DNA mismatch repair ATPase MutS